MYKLLLFFKKKFFFFNYHENTIYPTRTLAQSSGRSMGPSGHPCGRPKCVYVIIDDRFDVSCSVIVAGLRKLRKTESQISHALSDHLSPPSLFPGENERTDARPVVKGPHYFGPPRKRRFFKTKRPLSTRVCNYTVVRRDNYRPIVSRPTSACSATAKKYYRARCAAIPSVYAARFLRFQTRLPAAQRYIFDPMINDNVRVGAHDKHGISKLSNPFARLLFFVFFFFFFYVFSYFYDHIPHGRALGGRCAFKPGGKSKT